MHTETHYNSIESVALLANALLCVVVVIGVIPA